MKESGYLRWIVALALIILIVSCGSSGDDGDSTLSPAGELMTEADFSGEYRAGVIGFDGTNPWAEVKDLVVDGNGNVDVVGNAFLSFAYSVGGDGLLTADGERGQLSVDGNLFHLTDAGDDINISFGLRKSTGMTAADLAGGYHVFEIMAYPGQFEVLRFDFDFDGVSEVTSSLSTGTAPDQSAGYVVADNGELAFSDTSGNLLFFGQASPDGNVFLCVQDDTLLAIGIKKSTGKMPADYCGDLHISAMEYDPVSAVIQTIRESAVFDSTGNVVTTMIEASESLTDTSGDATINVFNSDGEMLIGDAVGHLSPDNQFMMYALDGISSSSYSLRLGLRKP